MELSNLAKGRKRMVENLKTLKLVAGMMWWVTFASVSERDFSCLFCFIWLIKEPEQNYSLRHRH
jgi:hypothetical protein